MATLTVELGDRAYPVHVDSGILGRSGELLAEAGLHGKIAVITNPTVAQLYLDTLYGALTAAGFEVVPVLVPDGEQYKDLKSLAAVYDRLVGERLDRRSCIVALGGGVIGDLAGFAAATYLRGVSYVQVPTTLLAQVDSSVGGKTAVNHRDGKNLIGAFYQPKLVLIDVALLKSLPHRELTAGLAEVIKYGIIADPALFSLLETEMDNVLRQDRDLLIKIITTSCAIKARVVEADERESDYRAVLNFGHTIGHALEAATDFARFLHGEAVAIGMVKAAAISLQHGFCDRKTFERVRGLITKAGLPSELPPDLPKQDLLKAMAVDKKSAAGLIKFVMCAGIGRTRFHALEADAISAALD